MSEEGEKERYDEVSVHHYSSLTVVKLRELCKQRGLKVGGVKKDLVERLLLIGGNSNSADTSNTDGNEEYGGCVVAADATAVEESLSTTFTADDGNNDGDNNGSNVYDNEAAAAVGELKPISSDEENYCDTDDNNNDYDVDEGEFDDDAFLPNASMDAVVKNDDNYDGDEVIINISNSATVDEEANTTDEQQQQKHDDGDDVVSSAEIMANELFEEPTTTTTIGSNDDYFAKNEEETLTSPKTMADDQNGSTLLSVVERRPEISASAQSPFASSSFSSSSSNTSGIEGGGKNKTDKDDAITTATTSTFEDDETDIIQKREEDVINGQSAAATAAATTTTTSSDNNIMGIKSNFTNTFNGKNGGVAEDADLLAELRAISSKASSSRFDDGNMGCDNDANSSIINDETIPTSSSLVRVKSEGTDIIQKREEEVINGQSAAAAAAATTTTTTTTTSEDNNIMGIKSNFTNTFNGKNGGVAEDADLLAELRAISSKASSSRFDDGNMGCDNDANSSIINDETIPTSSSLVRVKREGAVASTKSSRPRPPWKQKRFAAVNKVTTNAFDVDVVVATTAPAPPSSVTDPFQDAMCDENSVVRPASVEEKPPSRSKAEATCTNVMPPTENGSTTKSNLPNTFNGKNGGIAADADFLVQLSEVSNKASSVNRFYDDEGDHNSASLLNNDVSEESVREIAYNDAMPSMLTKEKSDSNKAARPLPPLNQKRVAAKKESSYVIDADVVVAAAPAPDPFQNLMLSDQVDEPAACTIDCQDGTYVGVKSNLPNTFNGKNGGAAKDADLLAELRAISNKASGRRFDGGDEDYNSLSSSNKLIETTDTLRSNKMKSEAGKSSLAAWKQKNIVAKKNTSAASFEVDFVVAAAPEPYAVDSLESACLNDQFRGDGNENIENLSKSKGFVSDEKPWKKKGKNSSNVDKLKREKKHSFDKGQSEPVLDPFQNALLDELDSSNTQLSRGPCQVAELSSQSTFSGKNGGVAEDAELLAELKAISNKSSNRFVVEDNTVSDLHSAAAQPNTLLNKPWKKNIPSSEDVSIQPWKRKGTTTNAFVAEEMGISVAAPSVHGLSNLVLEPKEESMGIKSGLPNTFKGNRGGPAEDADLLSELRAISTNSSRDRFADADGINDESSQNVQGNCMQAPKSTVAFQPKPTEQKLVSGNYKGGHMISSMTPFHTTPADGGSAAEITITVDGLNESLTSPNWQIRKASYLFLQELILTALAGSEPENQLSGEDVFSSLDGAITKALSDTNAGALDSALKLSVTYSDCCKGACSEDAASQIMSLLLKGAAFASSRPTTLKATQELVFKLVEVAPEFSSTADNVVDLIHQHGLKSKKPKVVQFAARLVLHLVQEFGTGVFSASKISAVHETLVGNSNEQLRVVGIEVLAELCRTFGSKTPMQALVDKLKKSQQSQLDSLFDNQPTPTLPGRRVRYKRGVEVTTLTPEEALVALKKSEEVEKQKRFASRSAVNLLHVLPQTCYKNKINEAKWSEKVEALNALIEAGGEQPYKITPPSGSINYSPLLRELKQLLSHTHYLVCSKALAAIGMLAEGVGDPISSDLKPLLPTIVPLFKDKKVGTAAMNCLEKIFGNALRFDDFLDSNNSFLSSLDEKKEKNALVRKSVLEFFARCVVSSGTYGTCGRLTSQHTEDLCKIACEKLNDSDATTRKAATDVLIALCNSKDDAVVSTADKVTSSLQSSNPRAYKTMQLATKNNKSNTSTNSTSRPGTVPSKTTSQPNKSVVVMARPTTAPKIDRALHDSSAPVKGVSASGTVDETSDDSSLPSFEESIDTLSKLGLPRWGDGVDEGGVLAGIQSLNWKQRVEALNYLATFYESNGDREFSSIPSLFVLVKTCTKSFQESNFNVAKAILDLFKVIFNIHVHRKTSPESFLYIPIVKLTVEKIGDRKLTVSSSCCLDSICTVKDPQRVMHVAVRAVDGVNSPLVHEAMLVWLKSFSVNFGVAALSQGVQDVLVWVLKECDSNNMKVKNAARDVMGELYTQLGPLLESFVKSRNINSSVSSLMGKVFKDNVYDPNASHVERKLKCITMSSSGDPKGGKGGNSSSMMSLPTTDLMTLLKNDFLDRMNDTGDKKSWLRRKEALDEVDSALSKCGGLLLTEGKAFIELKQLATNLRLRLNDSQSNLKPLAASVIGSLLSKLDDEAQAKLGSVVFPALVNAAMNDMKKTMRDAAVSALVAGIDRSSQTGGGTNRSSVEAFILSLESELSDAALKSSGLPDVLSFLSAKIETLTFTDESEKLSARQALAKVIVLSLLSSKSGSRSAAEKLLTVCSKCGFVPSASFDKEIGKLLPAQQRTVRSFIPKLSKQDQDLVDTFKKASERPRRPEQLIPSRQAPQVEGSIGKSALQSPRAGALPPTSNTIVENGAQVENPLQLCSARSGKTKAQRLAILGKGDSWPDYSEEPSSDTIQALRKSWASFIPSSSIKLLFPQSGFRSHEDCISGCDLISKAIAYSRQSTDSSFIEILDFIFKWVTCVVSLRDHTSGFRRLLSMILDLFKRLSELSYVIRDDEALLLLPYLLDKAGVAKSLFKEEILNILSFVMTEKVYPAQKFGSIVCVKVLEKSKSNPSRPLAAEQCYVAVQSAGVLAIGRKGLVVLGNALDEETVEDTRKAYLSLFELVVKKMKGDTDKLFSIKFSDKVKAMIMDRCGKLPGTASGSPTRSSLNSPLRKAVPHESRNSPKNGQGTSLLSSSAVAKEQLRARLQKSKEGKSSEGSYHFPPPVDTNASNSQSDPAPPSPRTTSIDTMYDDIMTDVNWMTKRKECTSMDIVRGTDAIKLLRIVISGDKGCPIDTIQAAAFREKIASDFNPCLITVASALNFSFSHGGKHGRLPLSLINETVAALSYLLRMNCCCSEMKQTTVEYLVNGTVSALLDERINDFHDIVKPTNKLAMRAVLAPSLDNSLNALIAVQVSLVAPKDDVTPSSEKIRSKFSRVLEKLLRKVIKDRCDSNPANPFGELEELGALLASIDWMLETTESILSEKCGPDELLSPSTSMARYLLTELVRCKKGEVRKTVEDLGDDIKFIEPLLHDCENELGLQHLVESCIPTSPNFRERLETLKRQRL